MAKLVPNRSQKGTLLRPLSDIPEYGLAPTRQQYFRHSLKVLSVTSWNTRSLWEVLPRSVEDYGSSYGKEALVHVES